jgi:hypothetical protein
VSTKLVAIQSTRNIAGYKIPDKGESWPVNYVLDGQQRVTSIYAVLSDKIEQDVTSSKYNPDLDIFEIYYDFSSKKFITKSELSSTNDFTVLLRNIIDPIKLVDELGALNKKYHQDAKELSSVFLNYEIPVVEIKNRTKEEVGVIFERINNTGTKLDVLDLMTAWTWTDNFHLLDSLDSLLEELEEKSFGSIDHKLMLQIISGIIIGSTQTENVLRLTGEAVRDNWEIVKKAVKAAVDFLSTEFKCSSIDFLPFHQQLIPLARFFSTNKRHTSDQIKTLKCFFWRTAFSDRYSTGQTTAKMDADIEFIDKVLNFDYKDIEKYKPTITSLELIQTKFSKANPITRAFLLLSAQYIPKDLTNGRVIDIGESLLAFNRKQYHHIFPNAFLNKIGISKDERFTVVNFCFLPSDSNKRISSKAPSEYLKTITPQSNKHEIMQSNLLPIDDSLYEANDYNGFLSKRLSY